MARPSISQKENSLCFGGHQSVTARRPSLRRPINGPARSGTSGSDPHEVQARNWRLAFFGTLVLSGGLAAGLVWHSARGTITPWVVQVDKLGQAQAVAPALADYRPTDPQIAWHLSRFIDEVRGIPADPIVLRQNWLEAYNYVTTRAR